MFENMTGEQIAARIKGLQDERGARVQRLATINSALASLEKDITRKVDVYTMEAAAISSMKAAKVASMKEYVAARDAANTAVDHFGELQAQKERLKDEASTIRKEITEIGRTIAAAISASERACRIYDFASKRPGKTGDGA